MRIYLIGLTMYLSLACTHVLAQPVGDAEPSVGRTIRAAMTEVIEKASGSDPADTSASVESEEDGSEANQQD